MLDSWVIQLIGAINGDSFLHVFKQLFEIHDAAVVLVLAVQPVRASDCLEEVGIMQLVIEVDVMRSQLGRVLLEQRRAGEADENRVG